MISSPSHYVCLDLSQKNKRVLMSSWALQTPTDDHQQQQRHNLKEPLSSNTTTNDLEQHHHNDAVPTQLFGKALADLHRSDKHLNLMFRQWTTSDMTTEFRKYDLLTLSTSKSSDKTVSVATDQYGKTTCISIMEHLIEHYKEERLAYTTVMEKLSNSFRMKKPELGGGGGNRSFRMEKLGTTFSFSGSSFNMGKKLNNRKQQQPCEEGSSSSSSSSTGDDTSSSVVVLSFSQMGRDVGMPFTYPIASAITYAIQGKSKNAEQMIYALNQFWERYSTRLVEKGKNNQFVYKIYRQAIGWCGWFLYLSYYRLAAYMDILPIDEHLSHDDTNELLDSIGSVGIHLMYLGFCRCDTKNYDDSSHNEDDHDDEEGSSSISMSCDPFDCFNLPHLRKQVSEVLHEEISTLLEIAKLNQKY